MQLQTLEVSLTQSFPWAVQRKLAKNPEVTLLKRSEWWPITEWISWGIQHGGSLCVFNCKQPSTRVPCSQCQPKEQIQQSLAFFFSSSFRLFQLHQRDLNLHPRTSSGQASRVDDFVWTAGVVSEDSLLITSSGRGDSDPNAFNTEGTNDVINPHWLQTLFQTLVHATSRVPLGTFFQAKTCCIEPWRRC